MRCTALILAGGSSSRMGGINKLFLPVDGVPAIIKSILAFERCDAVGGTVIAARDCDIGRIRELCGAYGVKKLISIVPGGASRADSAANAFIASGACEKDEVILVHDGARPYVSPELIERVAAAALEYGAAVPALPLKDTVKFARDGFSAGTPDRSSLCLVQTPQGFTADIYSRIINTGDFNVTDDAGLAERAGFGVKLVEGEPGNIKLTTPDDIPKENGAMYRIGHGYDVHRLAENRRLILGGVEIPYERGLLGHSDADVLVHAIMDAMLGALALGDIGKHFPDTDIRYKDADSMKLLAHVTELIHEKGYTLSSLDCTINAEKPKLSPYTERMRENIARVCGTDVSDISVKATTEEGLGLRGEGIGAVCVCLLRKK